MVVGALCMLGVIALWSIVPVLVKLLIPVFDPFTIAFMRLAQGAAVVVAIFFAHGHKLREFNFSWWHLIGGVGVGINYTLYALSLSYTTASAGALIVQVQYVTLALLATLVLHEQLTLAKVAGMVLVVVGVAGIMGARVDLAHLLAPRYFLGNVLMLFSGIGWGFYALANKALARRMSTSFILVPMLSIGAGLAGILATVHYELYQEPTLNAWAAVFALGVLSTGGAFVLVSEGMKRLSAVMVGSATAMAPIGQIALAHWFLTEPMTSTLIGGGGVILAGIFIMMFAERHQSQQDQ